MMKSDEKSRCLIELFIDVLGSRWNILIIWHLRHNAIRFTDLQKKMHGVNSNTLTAHLRELEELKIVSRVVFPEVPPRVEYSLTEHGKTLLPVFDRLKEWGLGYLEAEGMTMDIC